MQRERINRKYTGMYRLGFAALAAAAFAPAAHAGLAEVQEFSEMEEWVAAIGGEDAFTTIDFTGFPVGTFITDQYADLGIVFTDGNDQSTVFDDFVFPNDGQGLDGNGSITFELDVPQFFFAIDFPGHISIALYSGNEEIYVDFDVFGGVGPGHFGGIISDTAFDRVVLTDPPGEVGIDDLFIPVIPGPSAILTLLIGSIFSSRCKRRRCS